MALIPGQQRSLEKVKAMRIDLANQVASLINELGPKLYEDFNEVGYSFDLPLYRLTCPGSHEYYGHQQVPHLQVVPLDYGEERAALVLWMLKG